MEKEQLRKKWINFWYYNKVYVCIAVIVALVAVDSIVTSRQIVDPDYSVALISTEEYTDEELDNLKNAFQSVARDVNQDGKIKVDVRYYPLDVSGQENVNDDYIMVSTLEADLAGRISGLFLLEDPRGFQALSHILAYPDGSIPEEETDFDRLLIPIRSLPGLDGTGHDGLSLAIRAEHPDQQAIRDLLDALR